MDAYPGNILESTKGFEVKLIYIDRWQWEEVKCSRTLTLTCIFTELSPHNHSVFHNGCLSGQYLGKYKMNWNETWSIDRCQWEKGLYTRTIILLCVFTELSPLNHSDFHNGCLSRQYLGKYKRVWNETWFIDRWQWEEGQWIILPWKLIELSPLNHFS